MSGSASPVLEPSSAEPLVGNYFVAAYPLFSAWQAEQVPSLRTALEKPFGRAPNAADLKLTPPSLSHLQ
jgi:hypothetical protein